jgi:hypothetical protein
MSRHRLLGNDHETNETKAAARQYPVSNNESTVPGSVFFVVRYEAISRGRLGSVQLALCSAGK